MDRVDAYPEPDGHRNRTDRTWLAVLLASLVSSAWLLATKALGPWLVDLLGGSSLFFYLLAIPAYLIGLMSAVVLLVSAPAARRRMDALPLLLGVLALAVFLFAPLSRPLALLDFQRHFTVRAEVVRRIETGELWSGSPLHTLVGVPMEYPRSVSSGVGFRDVLVFREDDSLHVVFFPSVSFWPGPYTAFVYRSDGLPPLLNNRYLQGYGYTWSEPMAERWWRVVRDN